MSFGTRFATPLLVGIALMPGLARAQGSSSDSTAAPPVAIPPPATSTAADFPRGRISGYMFGDLYYNANGTPTHVYDASGVDNGKTNIDGKGPITQDLNGAQLRRVYFQLDNDLTVRYATRFRLEADSKSLTADGKITTFVKNAYFQAKHVVPRGDFFFGMITTPSYENSEEFWQYRSSEKMIMDFWGLASSSDIGAELKGYADPGHHVGYAAMIGDGTNQKPENNRFKKFYLSVPLRWGDLRFEPYADYQAVRVNLGPRVPADTDSLAVNNDQATYKIFAGYEMRTVAIGVEALDVVTHKGPAPNQEPRGLSVFARGMATPTLGWFARFDEWQPDHNLANRVDTQLWIAGVDWRPLPDVHIMPNLEATQYLKQGTASPPPHHDLQARVTFYYRFSRPQS